MSRPYCTYLERTIPDQSRCMTFVYMVGSGTGHTEDIKILHAPAGFCDVTQSTQMKQILPP